MLGWRWFRHAHSLRLDFRESIADLASGKLPASKSFLCRKLGIQTAAHLN